MIPQTQKRFIGPVLDSKGKETDDGGDCFAACLASILELPIEEIPNFLAGENGSWFIRWQKWLYDNYRQELVYHEENWPHPNSLGWWIAEVKCGDISHSVVFYREEFRWDPAPHGKKWTYTLNDVQSVVIPYSIAGIWDRRSGRYDESDHRYE